MAAMGHTMNHEAAPTGEAPAAQPGHAPSGPPTRKKKRAPRPAPEGSSLEAQPARQPPSSEAPGQAPDQVPSVSEGTFSLSAEVVTESGHTVAPAQPTRPLEQYSLDAARASRAPMPQKAQPATTPSLPQQPQPTTTTTPQQQPQPALQRQITLPSPHSQASPQLRGATSFRQPAGGAAESPGAGAPGGRKKKAPMPDITSREWQHHIADSLLSARPPKQGHTNNTYSIKADFSAASPARRTPGAAASPAQAPRAPPTPLAIDESEAGSLFPGRNEVRARAADLLSPAARARAQGQNPGSLLWGDDTPAAPAAPAAPAPTPPVTPAAVTPAAGGETEAPIAIANRGDVIPRNLVKNSIFTRQSRSPEKPPARFSKPAAPRASTAAAPTIPAVPRPAAVAAVAAAASPVGALAPAPATAPAAAQLAAPAPAPDEQAAAARAATAGGGSPGAGARPAAERRAAGEGAAAGGGGAAEAQALSGMSTSRTAAATADEGAAGPSGAGAGAGAGAAGSVMLENIRAFRAAQPKANFNAWLEQLDPEVPFPPRPPRPAQESVEPPRGDLAPRSLGIDTTHALSRKIQHDSLPQRVRARRRLSARRGQVIMSAIMSQTESTGVWRELWDQAAAPPPPAPAAAGPVRTV
jgi:hypothetical protein